VTLRAGKIDVLCAAVPIEIAITRWCRVAAAEQGHAVPRCWVSRIFGGVPRLLNHYVELRIDDGACLQRVAQGVATVRRTDGQADSGACKRAMQSRFHTFDFPVGARVPAAVGDDPLANPSLRRRWTPLCLRLSVLSSLVEGPLINTAVSILAACMLEWPGSSSTELRASLGSIAASDLNCIAGVGPTPDCSLASALEKSG